MRGGTYPAGPGSDAQRLLARSVDRSAYGCQRPAPVNLDVRMQLSTRRSAEQ